MKKRCNTLVLSLLAFLLTFFYFVPTNVLAENDVLLDKNNQEAKVVTESPNQEAKSKVITQQEQNKLNQEVQNNAIENPIEKNNQSTPQPNQPAQQNSNSGGNAITYGSIYSEPTRADGEVANWIERKGSDLISLLQRGAKYFAIVSFILCGGLMLFGSFGNSKLVTTGLLGICITLAVYATILHAPELMDKFVMWTRT